MKAHRKIIILNFPPEISGRPLICNLVRNFDLTFNILKAKITPRKEGYMTVELSGTEENYRKGIEYIKEHGVKITQAAHSVSRDEESCVHCGTCTAICPSDALHMDLATREVVFDTDRCTACGMCIRVCPVRAMRAELEENGNW